MHELSTLLAPYREYLEYERRLAKQTIQAYLGDVRTLILSIGDKPIQEITLADLRAHVRIMSKQGIATATIRRRIHGLNTFYVWAELNELVKVPISKKILLPKLSQPSPTWLDDEQLRRFVNTSSKHQLAWQLLAWFGLRRSELLSLDWKDLRLKENLLILRDTKSKKDRIMPIPSSFCTALAEHWKRAGCPESGRCIGMAKNALIRAFRLHLEACGLSGRGITLHSIRHSFATSLLGQGVNIVEVKELLGHTDLKTTMRYTHVKNSVLNSAMQKHVLNHDKKGLF